MIRKLAALAALTLLCALPAAASHNPSLIGRWTTERSVDGGPTQGELELVIEQEGDVDIDDATSADGFWEAPGMNGVLHGQLANNVLTGRWILGGATGTFVFTLDPADRCRFTGTWTTDGDPARRGAWNGRKQRCRTRP